MWGRRRALQTLVAGVLLVVLLASARAEKEIKVEVGSDEEGVEVGEAAVNAVKSLGEDSQRLVRSLRASRLLLEKLRGRDLSILGSVLPAVGNVADKAGVSKGDALGALGTVGKMVFNNYEPMLSRELKDAFTMEQLEELDEFFGSPLGMEWLEFEADLVRDLAKEIPKIGYAASVGKAGEAVGEMVEDVSGWFSDMVGSVTEGIGDMFSTATDAVEETMETVGEAVDSVESAADEAVEAVEDANLEDLQEALEEETDLSLDDVVHNVTDSIPDDVDFDDKNVDDLLDELQGRLEDANPDDVLEEIEEGLEDVNLDDLPDLPGRK